MNTPRRMRRRLAMTVIVIVAVLGLFVGKLVDIQVVHAAEHNAESRDKRAILETSYGTRGDIVDTNGVVLADSVDRFNITASPQMVKEFSRTVDGEKQTISVTAAVAELATATGRPQAEILAALTEDPDSNFTYVVKAVTLEVRKAVQALRIPWIWSQFQPARSYPNGAVAGNLVGFIGTDGPQAGLERTANDCLTSVNGSSSYERGADGVRIPGSTVTTVSAKDGAKLRLTIDSDFQWYVQQVMASEAQLMGAEWATAVVVRVKDGHIMAVADYPTVDPNDVDSAARTALGSLAFSTPYEPGSTMKALTIASLLDAGQITPSTQVIAPGRITLPNGNFIKDAWPHGDQNWTATGVLMNSSNTGVSILSDRLSADQRRQYMLDFGLNATTEVDFFGESSGTVPEVKNWDPVTNYAVQFGQGLTTTSAQMASIYQTLGNNGIRMPLTLVEGCEWPDGTVTELPADVGTRVVSEQAADETVQMLETVVSMGSLSDQLEIPGYRLAAKTGTAEIAENGVYGSERVISIAGLIPAEDPEYAIVLTVGKPVTMRTSSYMAPTYRSIMTQIVKTFQVEPSIEAAPILPLSW